MKNLIRITIIIFVVQFSLFALQNTQQRKLRKIGIREFSVPIHEQNREWLISKFNESADEFPVNLSLMIRNIIWQQRQKRIINKAPLLQGNIRSFWYSFVKLPVQKVTNDYKDRYKTMIDQFVYLVKDKRLMRYRDIGFSDPNKHNRKIGLNYHIILFGEKRGHYSFLEKMHKKYDITVVSLGGQPSLLGAEYFIDELKARNINIRQKFYLFSIVDFDPSGWIIRNAYLDDLKFYGMNHIEITDLINPDLINQEELDLRIYPVPIPDNMATKNLNWVEETGGIVDQEGVLYGLESEAIPWSEIEALLDKYIPSLIGKQK